MITLLNHNIIFITTKLFKKSGNLTLDIVKDIHDPLEAKCCGDRVS